MKTPSSTTLSEEETAALIETRNFLRELADSHVLNSEYSLRAKAHAAVINLVLTVKGDTL